MRTWEPDKRLLALCFAVHCADLGKHVTVAGLQSSARCHDRSERRCSKGAAAVPMPADEQQFVRLSGNPGKPLGFSLNWSARITSEFFAQVGGMQCTVHTLLHAG